jgi:phosphomannomutase / phosphoglucomutase
MKINPYIFREYDIRGIVDQDLSEEFAYLLGRAYAELARTNQKNDIAIGYDCRFSSRPYALALAKGLSDEGINCCLLGLAPTPLLYWALSNRSFGGGIQITGSHCPADMNGFKVYLGDQPLTGDKIQNLKSTLISLEGTAVKSDRTGHISETALQEQYISDLTANSLPYLGPRRLKIVVDAGNGVGGLVGPSVLRGLGVEIIELYCKPDGSFPNHHPDPTVPENSRDLGFKVKEVGADFGVGWDGDADRIAVVDEHGRLIYGDLLLLIFARELLNQVPGAKIVADVKCSSRLFNDLKKRGGQPIMWKTGHSVLKKKLKEINGELAGELAGHIIFKHRYYGFDDAFYAAARFVEIVSNCETPVSELLSDLNPMAATPEIKVACPDEVKFEVVQKAVQAFSDYEIETIDGVRISFEHGWGLVRASNTQPVLVLRFEAENEDYLEAYRQIVVKELDRIRKLFE